MQPAHGGQQIQQRSFLPPAEEEEWRCRSHPPSLGNLLRAHFLRCMVAVRLLTAPFRRHSTSAFPEIFPVRELL